MHEFDKGLKYLENKRYAKALPIFKALEKQYPVKEVYLNLGNCYRALDKEELAIDCYLKANDPLTPFSNNTFISTEYALALNNLGLMMGRFEADAESIDFYTRSLALEFNYDTAFNLANARLRQVCSRKSDDLVGAFELYESRFHKRVPTKLKNDKVGLQQWDGFSRVPSIVVLAEQGMGDLLMFSRYIHYLEDYCDEVWVQCDDRMAPLYKWKTCFHVSSSTATHGIPVMSLARVFGHLDTPAEWLSYKPKVGGEFSVGITYSGNKDHENDKYRSTSAHYFRELGLENMYTLNPVEHGTPGFKALRSSDWADQVDKLSQLDLVITVDTSIAHLCGSVGMPCWVLSAAKMNDFRWGDSSMGFDNIWYPSVRVFRNPNDWDLTFELVKHELNKYRDSLRTV